MPLRPGWTAPELEPPAEFFTTATLVVTRAVLAAGSVFDGHPRTACTSRSSISKVANSISAGAPTNRRACHAERARAASARTTHLQQASADPTPVGIGQSCWH